MEGTAVMNVRQCSLCEDDSLMFFNNATSSGSSNLLASFAGCLEVASAAFCFTPGMCMILK